ncbi:MAG TPA: HEAT repeat domain-containing protein, partial [Planctomycetota bacterium]|nr:HEAT repeat domain-containing protein [Planctomycetota bacterium]
PSLSGDRLLGEAARALRSGFDPLSLEERARELGEIRPLFKSPTLALRQSLTYEFKVFHDASIAEIMKEALRDSDVQVRRRAVEHWTLVRTPESIPLLIEALRDPDDIVKGSAIIALRGAPSLDAVPPLIEFLHASRSDLRTNAQETLKAIQQYFEEQEQWRKWYEEMKQRTAPRKEK